MRAGLGGAAGCGFGCASPFSWVRPGRQDPELGDVFSEPLTSSRRGQLGPREPESHPRPRTGPLRGARPHPSPHPLLRAGRRSRENEAQHPGGRVQEELAVGSARRGGGLHRHPAVRAGARGGACGLSVSYGPSGFPGPWEAEGKQGCLKKLSHWFKVEEETGGLRVPHPDLCESWPPRCAGRDQAGNTESKVAQVWDDGKQWGLGPTERPLLGSSHLCPGRNVGPVLPDRFFGEVENMGS